MTEQRSSGLGRLIARLGARWNLVPRDQVATLDAAYQRLLERTARQAWAAGVEDASHVLGHALGRESERIASEAPRGLLHMHPGDGDRNATAEAARAVADALVDLGISDGSEKERSTLPPYEPKRLMVHQPLSEELRDKMIRQARWFLLRYGRCLDEDEAYRRLDKLAVD